MTTAETVLACVLIAVIWIGYTALRMCDSMFKELRREIDRLHDRIDKKAAYADAQYVLERHETLARETCEFEDAAHRLRLGIQNVERRLEKVADAADLRWVEAEQERLAAQVDRLENSLSDLPRLLDSVQRLLATRAGADDLRSLRLEQERLAAQTDYRTAWANCLGAAMTTNRTSCAEQTIRGGRGLRRPASPAWRLRRSSRPPSPSRPSHPGCT